MGISLGVPPDFPEAQSYKIKPKKMLWVFSSGIRKCEESIWHGIHWSSECIATQPWSSLVIKNLRNSEIQQKKRKEKKREREREIELTKSTTAGTPLLFSASSKNSHYPLQTELSKTPNFAKFPRIDTCCVTCFSWNGNYLSRINSYKPKKIQTQKKPEQFDVQYLSTSLFIHIPQASGIL